MTDTITGEILRQAAIELDTYNAKLANKHTGQGEEVATHTVTLITNGAHGGVDLIIESSIYNGQGWDEDTKETVVLR